MVVLDQLQLKTLIVLYFYLLVQPSIEMFPSFLLQDRAKGPDEAVEEEAVDPEGFIAQRLLKRKVILNKSVLWRFDSLLCLALLMIGNWLLKLFDVG